MVSSFGGWRAGGTVLENTGCSRGLAFDSYPPKSLVLVHDSKEVYSY